MKKLKRIKKNGKVQLSKDISLEQAVAELQEAVAELQELEAQRNTHGTVVRHPPLA